MLFPKRFWSGIADGSITVAFRWWMSPRVVVGRPYRTPAGRIEVVSIDRWEPGDVTDDDARKAGYADAPDLVSGIAREGERQLYRVTFRRLAEPDPREVLANDAHLTAGDVAAIDNRLNGLDGAAAEPWTATTLSTIATHPGVRAGDLADMLGREKQPFKLDVRKLKMLGLTQSLRIGYRLSPRGEAYLSSTRR